MRRIRFVIKRANLEPVPNGKMASPIVPLAEIIPVVFDFLFTEDGELLFSESENVDVKTLAGVVKFVTKMPLPSRLFS